MARAFAHELLAARDADEDGVPQVQPESAGRHGPYPELRQCAHADARLLYVAMTRALDRLVLLSNQRNDFSQRIAIAYAREDLQGMG